MGIIARQGFWNFGALYGGVIIGMVNKLFLATDQDVMSREQLGFLEFIIAVSMLGSQISLFGAPNMLVKFFPRYDAKKDQRALIRHGFLITAISTVVVLVAGLLFNRIIFSDEQENPLFQDFFYSIFPLTVLLVVQEFLSAYLRVLLKTVVTSVVKDFAIRLYQLMLFLGLLFDFISYDHFIILYVLGHLFSTLTFAVYLFRLGRLNFSKAPSTLPKEDVKELYKYRITTFPVVLAGPILNQIDKVMLTSLLPVIAVSVRLEMVAVFAISAYMARLITIPARAITTIATPVVARELEQGNLEEVATIYRKSALNQLIFGLVTFCGIWVSLDEAYSLMPNKGFEEGASTFLFMGLANLIHVGMGINGNIVINSKFYWFASIGVPILAAFTIVSNALLIPIYGITGAALATLISLGLFNLMMFVFVWVKLNMQPLTWRSFYVIGLGLAVIWICQILPSPENVFASIGLKSMVVLLCFAIGLLVPKISEDINGMWRKVIKMVFRK